MNRRTAAARAAMPVAVAVGAALLVLGGYAVLRATRDDIPIAHRVDDAATMPVDPGVGPSAPPAPAYAGVPTRLRIPAIGVDTQLEALGLGRNGALVPPGDFAKAGWYAGGTAPGNVGPAVIAGHVDSRHGPAVFYSLRELGPGDMVEVTRGGRPVRFTVISASWYPKSAFPTEAVYGPTPDRQLRLITCGGVFDRSLRSYRDNLVVYAVSG